MDTRAWREIRSLLDEADAERRCLHVEEDRIRRNLQRAARAGRVANPLPGIFALPERWEGLDGKARAVYCMRALSRAHPSWVFAGPSAAIARGLSVSNRDAGVLYLATPYSPSRKAGPIRHLYVRNDEGAFADGIRTTSLMRTVYDCVRLRGFRRGLAVADSVLRVTGMPPEDFRREVDGRFADFKGVGLVREVARYADGASANGGESMARAAMIELGYELPELQMPLTDPVDGALYFADFYWELGERLSVVGELDGREKYENPEMTGGRSVVEVLSDERLRESRISAREIKVMRFSYRDSQDDQRFCRILDAYGIPKRLGVRDVT